MDTCAAIAVVIQVFGFGLVWAFVAGAAAAGRMGHSRRERQTAAQAAHTAAAVAARMWTTPAQIVAKVDADVTNLATAKTYIAKLTEAVCVLARKGLR